MLISRMAVYFASPPRMNEHSRSPHFLPYSLLSLPFSLGSEFDSLHLIPRDGEQFWDYFSAILFLYSLRPLLAPRTAFEFFVVLYVFWILTLFQMYSRQRFFSNSVSFFFTQLIVSLAV